MKKIFILLIVVLLIGCESNKDSLLIMVPSGIPLIAVGSFLKEDNIEITDVNNPSLLTAAMTSKSHDIVVAPLNLGIKAYNLGDSSYQLAGILTFGNSYIITRETHPLSNVTDLEGTNILAYGQNSIPDIALKTVLQDSNINAQIDYQANINLVVPFFISNTNNPNDESNAEYLYIMAAEPIISMLEIKYHLNLRLLDLQEELKTRIEHLPQAAVFVNSRSSKQDEISEFLNSLIVATNMINEDPEQYAKSIFNNHPYFESLTLEVLQRSLPRSQIAFEIITSESTLIHNYYQFMMNYDAQMTGNALLDQGFYR
ncbi:MAG: hypothetical protein AB7T03_00490 [Bacilli bacterium]